MNLLDVPNVLMGGALALDEKQPSKAHQAASAVLAYDPDNARAWALLGAAWEALQRPGEALHAYEQALNLDDRDLASALSLVRLYESSGRLELADALRTFALVRERDAPELRDSLLHPRAQSPSRTMPEEVPLAGRVKLRADTVIFYPSSSALPPVELPRKFVPRPMATQRANAQRPRGSANVSVPSTVGRQAHVKARDARALFVAIARPMSVEDPFTGEVFNCDHTLPVGTIVSAATNDDEWARVVGAPLAEPGTPRADEFVLSARRGLTPLFSPEVLDETAHLLTHHGIDDPALVDLTQQPFFAIDNEDSKDIDQLMWLAREGTGYAVHYALADAAHYIRPGMALHEEAIRRGTSFYMPGLNVPMLPRELSEGLISLLEGQDRRALVVKLILDENARARSTTMIRARVHNHHQLTYARVQKHFDGVEKLVFKRPEIEDQLGLLREIGQKRLDDAYKRGVIPFFRIEARKKLSSDGHSFVVTASAALDVERFNSEISVLTNVEGALELVHAPVEGLALPAIYRNHPPPPPERFGALRKVVRRIVEENHLAPDWHWRDDEKLGAYVQRLRFLPKNDDEKRIAQALDRQTVLINQRGVFSSTPGEHHGLMAKAYARLTAPMREVVGIETHQRIISRTILTRLVELMPDARAKLAQVTILTTVGAANDDEKLLVTAFLSLDGLSGDNLRIAAQGLLERLRDWPGLDENALQERQNALLDRVAEAGNLAADMQRQVDKDVDGLILDRLFGSASGKVFSGTVMGVSPAKVYVFLDEPAVEVKMYVADLARMTGCTWHLDADGVELRASTGEPGTDITIGQPITLRVDGKSPDGTRWVVLPASR